MTPKQAKPSKLRQSIIPKYRDYIRTVKFTGSSKHAKNLVVLFSDLPYLEELHMEFNTSWSVFGYLGHLHEQPVEESDDESDDDSDEDSDDDSDDGNGKDEAKQLRRAFLREAARKIQRLHLDNFELSDVGELVSTMYSLRSLSLVNQETSSSFLDGFTKSFRRLHPSLQYLTLNGYDFDHIPDWDSNTPVLPSLKSLTLVNVVPNMATFKFIDSFSATLESLSIKVNNRKRFRFKPIAAPATAIPLFHSSFPLLVNLTLLNVDCVIASLILESLTSPSLSKRTALQAIELQLVGSSIYLPGTPQLRPYISPFQHTLKTLRVSRYKDLCRVDGYGLASWSRPIQVFLGHPQDLFFERMEISKAMNDKDDDGGRSHRIRVRGRAAAIRETLEFGLQLINSLEEKEDLEGMEAGFDALEKLRVMRKLCALK
ncbi:hypothetical protein P7C70_g5828, partial [Phenoliferia sp. Uapishka_3]